MGKETKIGLVAISALLIVFGALLFRKLTASEDQGAPEQQATMAAAEVPSSAGMANKPAVVLAQKDPADPAGVGRGFWNKDAASSENGSEPAADAARQNFMPADTAPARDRYAEEDSTVPADEPSSDAASGSNPFKKSQAPAAANQNSPQADETAPSKTRALEIPDQEPVSVATNPLRRLSAQSPADEQVAAPEGRLAVGVEPSAGERADEVAPASEGAPEEDSRFEPKLAPVPDRDPPQAEPRQQNTPEIERPASEPAWEPGSAERQASRSDPPAVTNGRYTIGPNDNLWIISEKVYGTGGYFKALHEHNRSRLPRADRLVVGTQISVPPTTLLEQNYPTLCPKHRKSAVVKSRTTPASTRSRKAAGANVYVVEAGDTLFDIARYELGKASRWAEIYELNREILGEDFDHLPTGAELTLPPKAQNPDSFTRQDDSRLQR
jgi:nucleoid-associated protein YgaU